MCCQVRIPATVRAQKDSRSFIQNTGEYGYQDLNDSGVSRIMKEGCCVSGEQFSSILSTAPTRRALLEKGSYAFLSILCDRVKTHNLFRVGISLMLIQINLRVESLFAD